jgi:hypothetical protein
MAKLPGVVQGENGVGDLGQVGYVLYKTRGPALPAP